MIRRTTRPPSAQCTLPIYMGFLMSEPKSPTCTRLGEVMGISHDSVNRFLLRESYEPRDLFEEARRWLNVQGGTLNVDDSTLDKPYSRQSSGYPNPMTMSTSLPMTSKNCIATIGRSNSTIASSSKSVASGNSRCAKKHPFSITSLRPYVGMCTFKRCSSKTSSRTPIAGSRRYTKRSSPLLSIPSSKTRITSTHKSHPPSMRKSYPIVGSPVIIQ